MQQRGEKEKGEKKMSGRRQEKIAKIDRGKFTIAKMDRLVYRNFNAVHFGIFTTFHAPKFVLAWGSVQNRPLELPICVLPCCASWTGPRQPEQWSQCFTQPGTLLQ